MKNKIFVKLAAAFGVVILLFTITLESVFLVLFRNHTIDMNRKAMEEKAISIAETLSSFETKKGNGYGAFVRFLDELAMAEVWIVDEELQVYTCGKENQAPSYKELPENAERIVAQVFAGRTDLWGRIFWIVRCQGVDGRRAHLLRHRNCRCCFTAFTGEWGGR